MTHRIKTVLQFGKCNAVELTKQNKNENIYAHLNTNAHSDKKNNRQVNT